MIGSNIFIVSGMSGSGKSLALNVLEDTGFFCIDNLPISLVPSSINKLFEKKVKKIAIIGGGCFWCTEAVFESVPGVEEVLSGYAGGKNKNPTYEEICTGLTGHAEVIKITFDPTKISFFSFCDVSEVTLISCT